MVFFVFVQQNNTNYNLWYSTSFLRLMMFRGSISAYISSLRFNIRFNVINVRRINSRHRFIRMAIICRDIILANRLRTLRSNIMLYRNFHRAYINFLSFNACLILLRRISFTTSLYNRTKGFNLLITFRRQKRIMFRTSACMPVVRVLISKQCFSNSKAIRFIANGRNRNKSTLYPCCFFLLRKRFSNHATLYREQYKL